MKRRKIIAAIKDQVTGSVYYRVAGDGGVYQNRALPFVDHLAEWGQRATFDQNGVAVIEDIPKPEPLPKAYLWLSGSSIVASVAGARTGALVATVTFDEHDKPTVTRVTS